MSVKTFDVVAAAVTIKTGKLLAKGKAEVVRLVRGQKIRAEEDTEQVQLLLKSRAIVDNSARAKPVTKATLRAAARSMGGLDDPVKVPSPEHVPATPTGEELASVSE